MSHLPYFKFYAIDWLTSASVSSMTLEQQGAYARLLAFAWQEPDCGLPDDDSVLARLSCLGDRWDTDGLPVRRMFRWRATSSPDAVPEKLDELGPGARPDAVTPPNGRCYNRKLVSVRLELMRRSSGGSQAAKSRWTRHADGTCP